MAFANDEREVLGECWSSSNKLSLARAKERRRTDVEPSPLVRREVDYLNTNRVARLGNNLAARLCGNGLRPLGLVVSILHAAPPT